MMEVKKEEDMIIKQEMDDNKPTNGSNVQYKIDKSSQPIKTEKADDQQIKKEPQEQHGIDEIYAKSQLSQGQHRMTQRQHVFKLEEEIETEIVFDQSHRSLNTTRAGCCRISWNATTNRDGDCLGPKSSHRTLTTWCNIKNSQKLSRTFVTLLTSWEHLIGYNSEALLSRNLIQNLEPRRVF